MATCPECDAEIDIDDDDLDEMEVGDPWDCDACGSHLRVVTLDPLEFDSDDEDDEEEEDVEDEKKEEGPEDEDDLGDLDEGDADGEDSGDWDE